MRATIRIPIFSQDFLFNVYEEIVVPQDVPDLRWIDENWEADPWEGPVGPRYDPIALLEIHRLMKFKTCPFCRRNMVQVEIEPDRGQVLVCYNCFYWGGRGTRFDNAPSNNRRAILGRMNFVNNPDEVNEDILINHLANHHEKIINLSPRQAEKIVPALLRDYLNCEVKVIGGTKDGGIDALAVLSDKIKMIIQIKWREKTAGAERVSVIREVGGTLVIRGIPKGLIVSTRNRFSKSALNEVSVINTREIKDIGKIEMTTAAFNNILDMFNISAKKRNEIRRPQDIIPYYNDVHLFG